MKNTLTKNKAYSYTAYNHSGREQGGEHYCRALHTVLSGNDAGYELCQDCPLFGGFTLDENHKSYPECWYYDFEFGYSDFLSPREQYKRMEGLIQASFAGQFPEYLATDERAEKFQIIERAIIFAAEAHKGQLRKGTGLPYVRHPMETMMIVARMTKDNEVIAAAALHDVIEDTEYSYEDLSNVFGKRVADLVQWESEDKRPDIPKEKSWRIRKEENLAKEKEAPLEAKMIMLGDKLSNMRSTAREYALIGDKIWDRFNMKDPIEQEWYYRSVAESLIVLSETEAYKEYVRLLEQVF